MRYQIKNVTGDINNPDPDLHSGVRLYATSGQLQQLLPIDPQETVFVSSKALTELTSLYPKYIQVLDPDGSIDMTVAHRDKIVFADTNWLYYDLGMYAGKISITNPVGSGLLLFSLSGGTGVGTAPAAATISEVLAGETVTIDEVMEPVRYIYLKAAAGAQVAYILVN